MPKHEFGIMKTDPKPTQVFDDYEPEKYNCLSIDDAYIEPMLTKLADVDCYWRSLECHGKNINYYGITLIPPDSMDLLIERIDGAIGTEKLHALLQKAKEEHKFVIHFGI